MSTQRSYGNGDLRAARGCICGSPGLHDARAAQYGAKGARSRDLGGYVRWGGRILPLRDAPSDLAPIRGTGLTLNTTRVYLVSAPTSP
jgi:hypothetical protein